MAREGVVEACGEISGMCAGPTLFQPIHYTDQALSLDFYNNRGKSRLYV